MLTDEQAVIAVAVERVTEVLDSEVGAVLRAGRVVAVESRFADGTRTPGEENYIFIDHGDSTFSRYYHLTTGGVRVAVGDQVAAGDTIGASGNSGASAGPHLHFELHRNGRPVNPLDVAQTSQRQRLSGAELRRFKARVEEIDRAREEAPEMD